MTYGLSHAIKRFAPPIVWDAAVAILARPKKTFKSWEAASASASGYQDHLVDRFRAARAELNRKSGKVVALEDNPLLWVTALLDGPLSVTDFGGAIGEVGDALRMVCPRVEYTVVENPTLVALCAHGSAIHFTTAIPSQCDVFFTSSTLQYLKAPYDALAAGFNSAKRAVILVRNNFSEKETFQLQQSPLFDNGSGTTPPGIQQLHNRLRAQDHKREPSARNLRRIRV